MKSVEDKVVEKHLNQLDLKITGWMQKYGLTVLRIGLGIVFLWFGVLKFFKGLSPAEDLVRNTIYFIDPDLFIPVLALWESLIGLGLISGKFIRTTLLLLFLQMPGTALPLLILPEKVWTIFPYALTLEGQYIVKNLVLIGAGLVIGANVRSSIKN
ncbi:MAG TPA: DoxX family protein [Ignavibacteriaceae bacterium]